MGSWVILVAPARTPPAIVAKINSEVAKAMSSLEAQSRLQKEGATSNAASPEEMAEFLRKENEKFRKIVKDANIKAN